MTEVNELKQSVIKALRGVHDPEIPINIYDLGLIYDLEIDDEAAVHIRMTLTAPNCPMAELIVQQVNQAARGVDTRWLSGDGAGLGSVRRQ